MINSTGMKAALKQSWQKEPQEFTAEVRVDLDRDVLMVEMPSGATLGLDYTELCKMVARIEARRNA